jgi:peptide/nickel transport system ATP-binding protein
VVKKHIVLEGDIPSAMNPPTGCPFQTRCRYKHLVPDNLCETKVPPVKDLGGGHKSLCWLADDVLAKMEPVISFENGDAKASQTADATNGAPKKAPAKAVAKAKPAVAKPAVAKSAVAKPAAAKAPRTTSAPKAQPVKTKAAKAPAKAAPKTKPAKGK